MSSSAISQAYAAREKARKYMQHVCWPIGQDIRPNQEMRRKARESFQRADAHYRKVCKQEQEKTNA